MVLQIATQNSKHSWIRDQCARFLDPADHRGFIVGISIRSPRQVCETVFGHKSSAIKAGDYIGDDMRQPLIASGFVDNLQHVENDVVIIGAFDEVGLITALKESYPLVVINGAEVSIEYRAPELL